MKILLTGCSASQASELTNKRIPTFSGLVKHALEQSGNEVVLDSPRMSMTEKDLSNYDYVVVGLSSPMSVSSYRIYGALSVIERAKKVTNLVTLIDAPEPYKLWNGIRAMAENKESIVKKFYSRRPDYDKVLEEKELSRIHSVLVDLYQSPWNTTIAPSLPWSKKSNVTDYIPNLDEDSLHLFCLDSILLANQGNKDITAKSPSFWVANQKTEWTSKIQKTIKKEIKPMVVGKWDNNTSILRRINSSIGSIITTYKNEDPWWSVNLSQSLLVGTPVSTDWRQTSFIDKSWSYLPYQIEEMSDDERMFVSEQQFSSYLKLIKSTDDSIEELTKKVFIS